MRITETKLRRIIRHVLSEGEGDGLNDPQVEEAYYELQNMSPSAAKDRENLRSFSSSPG